VKLGDVAFAGDQTPAARKLLYRLISTRLLADPPLDRITMEPFEIVRDMLRNSSLQQVGVQGSIGGAPQLLKVFQYSRTSSFAVYWPDRNGGPHFHGRPCLSYENLDKMCFDPDTLESFYLSSDTARAKARADAEKEALVNDPFGGAKLVLAFLKERFQPSTRLAVPTQTSNGARMKSVGLPNSPSLQVL
jgi:hypothetical protein